MTACNLTGEFTRGMLEALRYTGIANSAVFIIQINKCTTYIYIYVYINNILYIVSSPTYFDGPAL
jgi:hypothetical protein